MLCTLFSIHNGFILSSFSGKVFHKAVHTQKDVVLFPSLELFPEFFCKVLMRHIFDGPPMKSVMIYMDAR